MTQPNLSELAKQGDPSAIATKMNQLLQPRGITATTEVLPGQCLQVVLESAQVLNRQVLATFVQRGLERLGVQAFNSIKLVGRQTGLKEPVWTQNILIAVPPSDQFTPVSSAMAEADPSMSDMTDSVSSRPIVPPPPPPNRGVGTVPSETTPAAAALHDFHDHRLSESSPELTGDYSGAGLTSYAPIPGAYRPLALNDDDGDDVAADPVVAASVLSGSPSSSVAPYSSSSSRTEPAIPAIDEYEATQYGASDYGENEYGDDYDVMPTGTHSLHYPEDLLEEPDEYGDDYDEGFVVTELPSSNRVEPSLRLDESDDYEGERVVAGTTIANSSDYFSEGAAPESYPGPYQDEPDLAELRGSTQAEEEDSPIPWTALIVSLVITWIIGLVGYALWSGANNRLAPQPQANNNAAPANASPPQASPTIATSPPALPANPPAQSPTAQSPAAQPNAAASSPGNPANPALQFNPGGQPTASPASPLPQAGQPTATASPRPTQSPQTNPPPNSSPQANAPSTASASGIAALAPPAIACRPVPFGANSGPVELSNLGFDTSVTDADGHYVVGCITNHSDQPIAKLTISFQGRSTQNQAVSQNSSTELTFANLRPRQAVPFRSLYTVNPDINTMTINSISWIPTGSAQPRQVQVNFPLRR